MTSLRIESPVLDTRGIGTLLCRLEGTACGVLREALMETLESLGGHLEAQSVRASTDALRQRLDEAAQALETGRGH